MAVLAPAHRRPVVQTRRVRTLRDLSRKALVRRCLAAKRHPRCYRWRLLASLDRRCPYLARQFGRLARRLPDRPSNPSAEIRCCPCLDSARLPPRQEVVPGRHTHLHQDRPAIAEHRPRYSTGRVLNHDARHSPAVLRQLLCLERWMAVSPIPDRPPSQRAAPTESGEAAIQPRLEPAARFFRIQAGQLQARIGPRVLTEIQICPIRLSR